MIASTPFRDQPAPWQRELASAITDPAELCQLLALDPALIAPAVAAAGPFGLRVPRAFVERMVRGDARDPLLLQVLPQLAEQHGPDAFCADPLQEAAARVAPGLLHKYPGRALLITTGACAVHCRYCFRREYPYGEESQGGRWQAALSALAQDRSLSELILSGGDPLSLTDGRLAQLSAALAPIRHLRRLRIHTRQPIVLPARVDAGLCAWLRTLPWPTVMVLHANHAREIDAAVRGACAELRATGITLLNQSVLLAGINDTLEALAGLSEALGDAGVMPYYLHQLDAVRGAAHFQVSDARARTLVGQLAAQLPGYLVPRLVREIPGAAAKMPIAPHFTGAPSHL